MAARQSNKVAIFGGCGFVGSALTRELVTTDRFDNVFVVDDLSAGKTWLLPDDPRVQFIQGDARDIELSFLGNPDLVYYLCADPYVPDSFRDPEHTINRNVGVLESFLKINSESLPEHLVYVSSGEVYGSVAIGCTSESDILKTEDLVQSSPYALSRGARRVDTQASHAERSGLGCCATALQCGGSSFHTSLFHSRHC